MASQPVRQHDYATEGDSFSSDSPAAVETPTGSGSLGAADDSGTPDDDDDDDDDEAFDPSRPRQARAVNEEILHDFRLRHPYVDGGGFPSTSRATQTQHEKHGDQRFAARQGMHSLSSPLARVGSPRARQLSEQADDGSYFGSGGSNAASAGKGRLSGSGNSADVLPSPHAGAGGVSSPYVAAQRGNPESTTTANANRKRSTSVAASTPGDTSHLLSPALSTRTTLSAGVSIGATMGGSERIFPIRSVVKPQQQPVGSAVPSTNTPMPSSSATGASVSAENIAHSESLNSTGSQLPPVQRKQPLNNTPSASSSNTQRPPTSSPEYDPSHSTAATYARTTSTLPHDDRSTNEKSTTLMNRMASTEGDELVRDEEPGITFLPSTGLANQPFLRRHDSNTASNPTTATRSSYPTTSGRSDDSDPTARRMSSTKPSSTRTVTTRSVSSREKPNSADSRTPLQRLDSQGKLNDPNDPTVRAGKAFARGETEAGPTVDSGALGSIGTREDGLYLNVRFEHQETPDGHMILTGRKGGFYTCEDEPIHVPGAIQDFGVLMAIEEDEQGNYQVVQVSENSGVRLGLSPKLLFGLKCFTDVLDEDNADIFQETIEILDETDDNVQEDAGANATAPSATNHFQLSGKGVAIPGIDDEVSEPIQWSCWCAIHRPDPQNRPKLAIVEFELENDVDNPISRVRTANEIEEDRAREQSKSLFHDDDTGTGAAGRADGEVPRADSKYSSLPGTIGHGGENDNNQGDSHRDDSTYETDSEGGLGSAATQEEIDASTRSRVQSVKALRRLRRSNKGHSDTMKLFGILAQVNDELSKTEDLQTSLEIAVGVVSEITGFHRVMVYQFDEEWNGQVVAELVDYKQTRDLYRGLHFPASDIPAQARELYKINKVRLLYDRDQPTARLVCRSLEELKNPLNLTHAHLRAMSPIHIKYLANMGVRASMSISIMAFGQLWGLISCHTYGRYGQRVSFPGRHLCRILSDNISRNIERLSYAQRLQSRKLINTIPTSTNPGGYIVAKAEDLLTLFEADFGVLSVGEEAKILGSLDNSQEVLVVLEYLRMKQFDTVQCSLNISSDYEDLEYPAGFQQIAGMLAIPLARAGQDFIALFRRGQVSQVHWAGNPYDKVMRQVQNGKLSLEPRKSFRIWSETVIGKCRGWTDENLEAASILRLVYGKFIEVWRQREAALTSSKLTSLLLSNAAHEVRTPLNHIINYLEMALEGQLDDDTRESLVRSHSASRSLVHVVNDLLDLTRAQTGQQLFLQDPLDLGATIDDAVAIHRFEALRKGIGFEIVENPLGTPQTLLGDRGKIRQIVANVTANAVKHTHEGSVNVEWGELPKMVDDSQQESSLDTIKIGIAITDTGDGIPEEQLETMFRTFEQVDEAAEDELNKGAGSLGLGLAVVARIVSHLGGQLRVESKVGQGSKFTFVLFFRIPGSDDTSRTSNTENTAIRAIPTASSGRTGLTQADLQQIRDTQRSDAQKRKEVAMSGSGGSKGSSSLISGRGSKNSKPSEIDSLVDAISANPDNSGPPAPARRRSLKLGQLNIEDSDTPLRSIKVDESTVDMSRPGASARPQASRRATYAHIRSASGAAGAASSSNVVPKRPVPQTRSSTTILPPKAPESASSVESAPSSCRPMRIMIVEDDAINRAILMKKLTKDFSHKVKPTVHGEEAVRLYEKDRDFDIILMDLQMPICDGFTATQRIRHLEAQDFASDADNDDSASLQARAVPIFAVSASLHQDQKPQLDECGFSGFILKPVDFARLQDLMRGVDDPDVRIHKQYQMGRWEQGGWLPPTALRQSFEGERKAA